MTAPPAPRHRYRCPVCGQAVEPLLPSAVVDTCRHIGTPREAARPARMIEEGT